MANLYVVDGVVQLMEWTARMREVLLEFAATLKPEDYTKEIAGLGHGSIRNTLVHTARSEDFWLLRILSEDADPDPSYWRPDGFPDAATLRPRWDAVIESGKALLRARGDEWLNTERMWQRRRQPDDPGRDLGRFTPAMAVLHTVTHEFHHKGQVVFAARQLGYPPPETDLM